MRRVARGVGRLLGALLSLGLVAAVVLGAVWIAPQGPVAGDPVDPVEVPVAAPPTDLVCPGPARLPTEPEEGGDVGYDPQFDPAPVDAVTTVSVLTVRRPDGAALPAVLSDLGRSRTLQEVTPSAGAGVDAATGADAGSLLHADADSAAGATPAWLAGSVVVSTTAGDLRGLVGATCRPAGNESWLVGGSTLLGSSARLVLQNPGSTAASVDLEVWGASGPVELAGSSAYLVPPGSERVVLLEGVAAEQARLVVHVVASGGLVAAYLQDSSLDGLVPTGVDDVVPGGAPATRQVIPGVALGGGGTGDEQTTAGDDLGVVRLLAPTDATTAQVWALGPAGQTPVAEDVALTAGEVVDIPLDGLDAGVWTLLVQADAPVVAAAEVVRGRLADAAGSGSPVERAWASSVPEGTSGPLALPSGAPEASGPSWRVSLAVADPDGGPAQVEVDLVAADGTVTSRTFQIQPGTARAVGPEAFDLSASSAAAGVVVRSQDDRVAWAVVLESEQEDGWLVTVLSPVPPAVPRAVVDVELR